MLQYGVFGTRIWRFATIGLLLAACNGVEDKETPPDLKDPDQKDTDVVIFEAVDGSAETNEDASVDIVLEALGEPEGWDIVQDPISGLISGEPPNITYTPNPDFNGDDEFAFSISDGAGTLEVATILLTVFPVNDRPLADSFTLSTAEDTPVDLALTGSDVDGDIIVFQVDSDPMWGSLDGTPPNLTYTPPTDFTGADSFTFVSIDGASQSEPGVVTIGVTGSNDAPTVADSTWTTTEDSTLGVLLSGLDNDMDPLTFEIVTQPVNGFLAGTGPSFQYTPDPDFFGADSFTFKANDGSLDSNTATLSLVVIPLNDIPEADDVAVGTNEDEPVAFALTGSDVDGDPINFTVLSQPSTGVLTGTAPNLSYTPNANTFGTDSFTYQVDDGHIPSSTATVTITVASVNDQPTADAFATSTTEETPVSFTFTGSDVDGDPLAFSVSTVPANGQISGTSPTLTYTPDTAFNGTDTFTVVANDGTVDSEAVVVTVLVTAVNDVPTADDATVATDEDAPVSFALSAQDEDGDSLDYTIQSEPTFGTLSGTAPNLTYTPDQDANGTDSFTWWVSDGQADSSSASITINVRPVNDPPTAQSSSTSTSEESDLAVTLGGADIDGDPLTYEIVLEPTSGVLTGTAPNLTYTPDNEFNGLDVFSFRVYDGTVYSAEATITINVGGVNDAPTVSDAAVTTDEDEAVQILLVGADEDGDPLTFEVIVGPTMGVLSGTTPNLTYTPNPNANGTDSFTYRANDGSTDSNVATLTVNVTAVNDAPIASSFTTSAQEDGFVAVVLGASDVDGDALTWRVTAAPTSGVLTGQAPNLTYTPNPAFSGTDSFTFVANDGQVDSAPATGTINVGGVNDAPTVTDAVASTNEDQATAIVLTGWDQEGDSLTFEVLSGPSFGTLSGSSPNLTYTPNPNANGTDSFTYRANDGDADSNVATVTVTVAPVNDIPLASNLTSSAQEDGFVNLTLSGSDVDGDAITWVVKTQPTNGSLTGTAPNLTYTPDPGFNGSDTFTFAANDGLADSADATATINVGAVNDAPVVANQGFSTDEDTPVDVTVVGTDDDGDDLTWIVVSGANSGTVTGSGPEFNYSPDGNFYGVDTFTVRANDGTTDSNVATVTVTVDAINDAPVASNVVTSAQEDSFVDVVLGGSDVDGDPITWQVTVPPANGSLTGTAPNLTYTPDPGFNGTDTFTFVVNDGQVDSPPVTVTINVGSVNDVPVVGDQGFSTNEDQAVDITVAATDEDGDALTWVVVSSPTMGTLTGTGPDYNYAPNTHVFGVDTFTIRANDGTADSNVATITMTVNSVNDAPVVTPIVSGTNEDTPAQIVLTASDVDGDPLTYSNTNPANGTLSGTAPNLTYTPDLNFNGTDTFTFQAHDGLADSASVAVTMNVAAVNDAPIAHAQSTALAEDGSISLTLTGSDVDGDSVSFAIAQQPTNGSLSGTPPFVTYTPNGDYSGSDSFTFVANDGSVDSTPATVSLTINPTNDAPVASAVSVSTDEDNAVSVTLAATDIDGDPLTYNVVGQPSLGTLSGTAPNLTYTPNADANGSDSFTWTADDGSADTGITTAIITISAINDIPAANGMSLSTSEDQSLAFVLSGSDVDGDPLTFSVTGQPSDGNLTGTAPNLTFTPNTNFTGSDTITFVVNDGSVDSPAATVTITVGGVNDAPTADDQALSTNEDTPVGITLTGDDLDGDSITFSVLANPSRGVLSGTAPNLTYTPNGNVNGADSFTFRSNDGVADSAVATVTLTVNPINDTPFANAQTLSLAEDGSLALTLSGSDVDGDALSYNVLTMPVSGGLEGTAPNLTYSPVANFNGTDSFTFTVNDGQVSSATATVTFNVSAVNDPPVANNNTIAGLEDQPVSFTLTGSDVDGDTLSFTVLPNSVPGTLSGTAPTLTFTPNANYNGTSSFTFTVNDGVGDSAAATVTLSVAASPDAPVANPVSVSVDEDAAGGVVVNFSASDADGDSLSYNITTTPGKGSVSGSGSSVTYFPSADQNGTDTFTYEASDGLLTSAPATVTVTINPINDAPVPQAQTVSTSEETPIAVTLTGTDVEGSGLTYTVTTSPGDGQLTGTAPNLTYTPDANYSGVDTFTFNVNDGSLDGTTAATVTIIVGSVNDTPVASSASVSVNEDSEGGLSITLAATDDDGDDLSFTVTGNPSGGVLSGVAPNLSYQPDVNFNGSDSFTFTAFDGLATSNTATISITVNPINDPPTSSPVSITMSEDGGATAATLGGFDVDGDSLTYNVGTPTQGSLSGTAPNLTYTPPANFNGSDSFTYSVYDGAVTSNTATVSITVSGVNDAPVATDGTVTLAEDPRGTTEVILSGTDIDGDLLTYTVTGNPTNGVVGGTAPNLTYNPNLDYFGPDTITFQVQDPSGASDTGTISITVTAVNDTPQVTSQTVSTNEDESLAIALVATDVDSTVLSYSTNTGNLTGSLSGTPPNLTYTPPANWNGSTSFTFTANDGQATSANATVSIDVINTSDAPIATGVGTSVAEDQTKVGTLIATDPDGDPLTYSIVSNGSNGAASITAGSASYSYTPNANYNGSDSFTWRAYDGTYYSNIASVTITVTPVADSPTVTGETYTTVGNTTLTVDKEVGVLSNDYDVDGDSISVTYAGSTSTNGGRVSVDAGGGVVYTPPAGFEGDDTFTYTVSDPLGYATSGTVTVTVTDMVWYVDNSNTGPQPDGTDVAAFPTLNFGAEMAESGDVIYVDYGLGSMSGYDMGITLSPGVDLIGEGEALVVGGSTIRSAGNKPTIGYSGGQAATPITAQGDNEIAGIILDGSVSWYGIWVTGDSVLIRDSYVYPLLAGIYGIAGTTTTIDRVDFMPAPAVPDYFYAAFVSEGKMYIDDSTFIDADFAAVTFDRASDGHVRTSSFTDSAVYSIWIIDPEDSQTSIIDIDSNGFIGMADDGTASVYVQSSNVFGKLVVDITNNSFNDLYTEAVYVDMNAGQVDLDLEISNNTFTDIVGDGVRIELQSISPDLIQVNNNTFKNIAARQEAVDIDARAVNTGNNPIQIIGNTSSQGGIDVFSDQLKPNEFEVVVDYNWFPNEYITIRDDSTVSPGTRASLQGNDVVTMSLLCADPEGGMEVGLIENYAGKFFLDGPAQGSCRRFGFGGVQNIGWTGLTDWGNAAALGNKSGTGSPYLDIRESLEIIDIDSLP